MTRDTGNDDLEGRLRHAYSTLTPPPVDEVRLVREAFAGAKNSRRRFMLRGAGIGAGIAAVAASAMFAASLQAPPSVEVRPADTSSQRPTEPADPTKPSKDEDAKRAKQVRDGILRNQRYIFPQEFAAGTFGGLTVKATGEQGQGETPAWGMVCDGEENGRPIAETLQEVSRPDRELRLSIDGYTTGTGAAAFKRLADNTGSCRWREDPVARPWSGQDTATHRLWRTPPHRVDSVDQLQHGAGRHEGPPLGPGAALAAIRVGDLIVHAAAYAPTQAEAERMATSSALATAEVQRQSDFPPAHGKAVPGSQETTPKDPMPGAVPASPGTLDVDLLAEPRDLGSGWRLTSEAPSPIKGGNLAGGSCLLGTGPRIELEDPFEPCPTSGPEVPMATASVYGHLGPEGVAPLTGNCGWEVSRYASPEAAERGITAYFSGYRGKTPSQAFALRAKPRAWPGTDEETHRLYVRPGSVAGAQAIAVIRVGSYVVSSTATIHDDADTAEEAMSRAVNAVTKATTAMKANVEQAQA